MSRATVYMIPCPISEDNLDSIPPETIRILHQLDHFIVEKAKSARRFIKASGHPKPLNDIEICEITSDREEISMLRKWLNLGLNVGVLSEAGCPGIADPGAGVVAEAHRLNNNVVPLVGPSSIIMALMASGFNGQQFSFVGYLPNKKPQLTQRLKQLEQFANKGGTTQIFIETPYRNDFLLTECINTLQDNTYLSISCGLNGPDSVIHTMKISEWKKSEKINFHKIPCIFSIGTL